MIGSELKKKRKKTSLKLTLGDAEARVAEEANKQKMEAEKEAKRLEDEKQREEEARLKKEVNVFRMPTEAPAMPQISDDAMMAQAASRAAAAAASTAGSSLPGSKRKGKKNSRKTIPLDAFVGTRTHSHFVETIDLVFSANIEQSSNTKKHEFRQTLWILQIQYSYKYNR